MDCYLQHTYLPEIYGRRFVEFEDGADVSWRARHDPSFSLSFPQGIQTLHKTMMLKTEVLIRSSC